MNKHVTSLELSKRLKEKGVKQKSEFYWAKDFDINENFTGEEPTIESLDWLKYHEMENAVICSAYLSSELGEMKEYLEEINKELNE